MRIVRGPFGDIIIKSRLSQSQMRRLRRMARDYATAYGGEDHDIDPNRAFVRSGRNRYSPVYDGAHVHDVARHMMVVAGTTFEYEWDTGY